MAVALWRHSLDGRLVIIAFHQYWRSPAAIIVSVVGWFFAYVEAAADRSSGLRSAGNAVYSSGASAVIWCCSSAWPPPGCI